MIAPWQLALCFASFGDLPGTVVLDRVAVIVDKHGVKLSDIQRDLQVAEFLNREPSQIGPETMRKSVERLIDQTIIPEGSARGGYARSPESEADATFEQLVRHCFGGSGVRMRNELARNSLTEAELREQLLWRLTVLRFIDERLQPGVQIGDNEVRSSYDLHLAEYKRLHPNDYPFEGLEAHIRQLLEGEAVNKNFGARLDAARKRARIEYRPQAFQ